MADITIPTRIAGLGGMALKAAGLVAATANHTAVTIGKCKFSIQIDWTACENASNDELYVIPVEANTEAAPTVWNTIGFIGAFGATEKLSSMGDTPATGSMRATFDNPYDHQVRLSTYVSGTIATGMNFAANLYPADAVQY